MAEQSGVFVFDQIDQFANGQTSIRRPREFAFFSYDDNRIFLPFSTQSLSFYYPPLFDVHHTSQQNVFYNLSQGFDTFVRYDDTQDEHLDSLLQTLRLHEENLLQKAQNGDGKIEDVRTKADFVTWRGMMTKFLVALFDEFNEFEMNATLFQDTIYMEENHAAKDAGLRPADRGTTRPGQPDQELMQYWGYKFEVLSTLPKPWSEITREEIERRDQKIVNNHAQYCSIVRTGIGNSSLVIAGEVDAVLGQKPEDTTRPIPWIELKTSQDFLSNNRRDLLKFERKLLRFWAQSFLLGVPSIVIGFRNSNGQLTRIQDIETQKIPQQVKQRTWAWDGNASINFASQVLEFLKRTITGEGVWRIQRVKGKKVISVFKTEERGTGSIIEESFKTHRGKLQLLEIAAALGKSV